MKKILSLVLVVFALFVFYDSQGEHYYICDNYVFASDVNWVRYTLSGETKVYSAEGTNTQSWFFTNCKNYTCRAANQSEVDFYNLHWGE